MKDMSEYIASGVSQRWLPTNPVALDAEHIALLVVDPGLGQLPISANTIQRHEFSLVVPDKLRNLVIRYPRLNKEP